MRIGSSCHQGGGPTEQQLATAAANKAVAERAATAAADKAAADKAATDQAVADKVAVDQVAAESAAVNKAAADRAVKDKAAQEISRQVADDEATYTSAYRQAITGLSALLENASWNVRHSAVLALGKVAKSGDSLAIVSVCAHLVCFAVLACLLAELPTGFLACLLVCLVA